MQPFYQHNGITLFNIDCRAFTLPEKPALVLTDPPYGMSYKHGKGATKNGKHHNRGHLPPVAGDNESFDPSHLLELNIPTILWGANHYADRLPASPAWYIWDKRDGMSSNDNSDCELAWVNFGGSTRVFRHVWNGVIRASENGEKHLHATQKPVALFLWCIQRAKLAAGSLIFDPYMGSGPCAIAAKLTGMRYIGIDTVSQYCETTVARLNDEFMPTLIDDGASLADLPLFAI